MSIIPHSNIAHLRECPNTTGPSPFLYLLLSCFHCIWKNLCGPPAIYPRKHSIMVKQPSTHFLGAPAVSDEATSGNTRCCSLLTFGALALMKVFIMCLHWLKFPFPSNGSGSLTRDLDNVVRGALLVSEVMVEGIGGVTGWVVGWVFSCCRAFTCSPNETTHLTSSSRKDLGVCSSPG